MSGFAAGRTSPLATVLVVEDDPDLRALAVRILRRSRYAAVCAGSVEEARRLWGRHRPDVALVDMGLPGEPGSAILDEAWVRRLDTAVVMVTGVDDVDLADNAFERGAYGCVVKPYTPNELLMHVSSALRRRGLERSAVDQVYVLERKIVDSTAAVAELRARLETIVPDSSLTDQEVVRHLRSAIRLRDDRMGRHIERVSLTASTLAQWCGFDEDPAPAIQLAAAMHDVGKIGIPDWVLLKPGPLTAAETTIIQRHSELGYALLSGSSSPIMQLAALVALNHHERWDGRGYPNRRIGDEIPLVARITSVTDVFDALTSDRVYRHAMPIEAAINIMRAERGGLFDPRPLDLFIARIEEIVAISDEAPDPRTEVVGLGRQMPAVRPMASDGLVIV